jgi:hypothetical protein
MTTWTLHLLGWPIAHLTITTTDDPPPEPEPTEVIDWAADPT